MSKSDIETEKESYFCAGVCSGAPGSICKKNNPASYLHLKKEDWSCSSLHCVKTECDQC